MNLYRAASSCRAARHQICVSCKQAFNKTTFLSMYFSGCWVLFTSRGECLNSSFCQPLYLCRISFNTFQSLLLSVVQSIQNMPSFAVAPDLVSDTAFSWDLKIESFAFKICFYHLYVCTMRVLLLKWVVGLVFF
jgi:hypothetical protein